MEVTHERIIEAHRRFENAKWRLDLENKRAGEKIKWIISHNEQIRAYQDRLRIMNEISREKADKLRLVYRRIELQGQILTIKEGLKRAVELTSRAQKRVHRVYEGLENMSFERWEFGIETFENNSVFEGSSDEMEDYAHSSHEKTRYENLILNHLEKANTRIQIANDKCVSLEKRKRELIMEIENCNKKKGAVKARLASKEKGQNASLKLYFVEFGAI